MKGKFPQKRSIEIPPTGVGIEGMGFTLYYYSAHEIDRWRKENRV